MTLFRCKYLVPQIISLSGKGPNTTGLWFQHWVWFQHRYRTPQNTHGTHKLGRYMSLPSIPKFTPLPNTLELQKHTDIHTYGILSTHHQWLTVKHLKRGMCRLHGNNGRALLPAHWDIAGIFANMKPTTSNSKFRTHPDPCVITGHTCSMIFPHQIC